MKGVCFVCGKSNPTKHHLRDFKSKGKGKVNGEIPLCRKCHNIVEEAKVWMKLGIKLKRAYLRGVKDGLERYEELHKITQRKGKIKCQ